MPVEAFSVVIVGGGTSGWITASWLAKHFKDRPEVRVTLVESKSIGTIGVGEATLPTLIPFLQLLGIAEAEFMTFTKATFKQGILYRDWTQPTGDPASPDTYFHPFDGFAVANFSSAEWWLTKRANTAGARYADDLCAQYALAAAGKSPRTQQMAPYTGEVGYAYHLDAELLANFLAQWCRERGVEHVIGDVTEVNHREDGAVKSVGLRDGASLEGDLFIDCSGFRGLMINRALGNPFISYNDVLFCDRAVAVRVPKTAGSTIRPFTTTTAKEAGWIWEIDLRERSGVGYVHSSRHTTFDEAEDVLRRHLGPVAEDLQIRRLEMRVGRSARFWHKNVVAIGLSGGFIEPLESTGIYLVEIGARFMVKALTSILGLALAAKAGTTTGEAEPDFTSAMDAMARRYDARMIELYEEIRDFIKIHYCLTKRRDSAFWRDNVEAASIPDSLREKLDLWSIRPPEPTDFPNRYSLFGDTNWLYIMLGMGWRPSHYKGFVSPVSEGIGGALMRLSTEKRQKGLATLPDHRAYFGSS
ncbi:MAG: tryptophan halogenase family protein [Caulobacteraceae bacterium]